MGKLPEDWKLKKLGEVAKLETGGSAPQGERYFRNGRYPFIRVQHFNGTKEFVDKWDLITDEAVKDYRLKLFPAGTIVFPKSGASIHLEKRAKLPIPSYVVNHLCCVLSKSIDNNFLFYFLKHTRFSQSVDGSTLPYLNLKELAQKIISVPPLPEQRKIAAVLSLVQRAIEQQERLIQVTTELKKALMKKLFTEGLHGEPQKMTEIGPIPESWKVVALGEVCEFTKKPKNKQLTIPLPFIPMSLIPNDEILITSYELKKSISSGTYVEKGDLLLAKITPSFENGKQGILEIPFNEAFATTEVIPIKTSPNKSAILYIFYCLLRPEIRKELAGKMEGTTGRQRLSKNIIRALKIPLPNYIEQVEIGNIFKKIDELNIIRKQRRDLLQSLFRTLLHQLMTAQIRVNDIDLDFLKMEG